MGMVKRSMIMVIHIKVPGKKIRKTDKANYNTKMETFLKEYSQKIKNTTEFKSSRMVMFMKDIGKITSLMG